MQCADDSFGRGQQRTVLIVEDEAIVRAALAALLDASGFITSVAGSAEAAIESLDAGNQPQIALVDLDLPGMNGAEFIGKLSMDRPSVFPVLISAAETERVERLLGESVIHLRKPVDFSVLLTVLDTHRRPD